MGILAKAGSEVVGGARPKWIATYGLVRKGLPDNL